MSHLKFVNLHCHTGIGSIYDAIDQPIDYFKAALDADMDALAITEHGNCNSVALALHSRDKLIKEGRPIKYCIGVESYFIPSLDEWRQEYEKNKLNKKTKKSVKDEKKNTTEEGSETIDDNEGSDIMKSYLRGRSHLVLLAQNQVGLNNLYSLVSASSRKENFYRYPRIDFELLRKHNEGLLATSACLSGYLSVLLIKNKEKSEIDKKEIIREAIQKFQDIFGDRFYGELQWNAIKEQHEINQMIIQLSYEMGYKLISAVDCHYPIKKAWKDREIYKRMGWIGKSNKPNHVERPIPNSIEEMDCELFVKNGDQVWEAYKKYSKKCGCTYDDDIIRQSIENTYQIAHERIENFEPDKTIRLPQFVVPKGETPEGALSRLAIEGLKRLGKEKNKEYITRLKKEVKIIHKNKFSRYFLTMKAIIDFANKEMLTGSGRGSSAGSLTAYCLGITQIDPIRHNLQFERFMSAESTSMPDIDTDFEHPMLLKENLAKEWGENCVVPISNFSTLQTKSLIKDISRFYDIPFQEVNEVTNKILEETIPQAKKDHDITAGVYNPTLEEIAKYSESYKIFIMKYPFVEDHLRTLAGQSKALSRHASGTLVSENLNYHMPLINSGGVIQSPWPEGQTIRLLEPMGFIKFDILGLASLRMIRQAIYLLLKNHFGIIDPTFEQIKEYYNNTLHPDVIDFNDQKVYDDVFCAGKFFNIFQFQETGAQNFCVAAKPKSLEDIVTITSIYRPGPLSSDVDKKYLEAKDNPESITYDHPILKEIMSETFGCLIFQETIASIAHKMGKNISLEEGNQLRKLLVKRGDDKSSNKKEKIYKKYLEGCIEKGLTAEQANKIWDTIEKSNSYLFNKSHSLSYCTVSFQCAYLQTYYPLEWACAFLEKDTEHETKKERAISSAKQMGFKVQEVDINLSSAFWEGHKEKKDTIIQPLSCIKSLGDVPVGEILKYRPFNTIEELLFHPEINYTKFNKKCLEALIKSQAANCLMDNRFSHLRHFYLCVCEPRPKNKKQLDDNIIIYGSEKDFSEEEKINFIVEFTGVYPLEKVVEQKLINKMSKMGIEPISDYKEEKKIYWAIVKEVLTKKTSKGKLYYEVILVDNNFALTKVKCWGVTEKDKFLVNHPYLVEPTFDPKWGFSTNGYLAKSWKLLG